MPGTLKHKEGQQQAGLQHPYRKCKAFSRHNLHAYAVSYVIENMRS